MLLSKYGIRLQPTDVFKVALRGHAINWAQPVSTLSHSTREWRSPRVTGSTRCVTCDGKMMAVPTCCEALTLEGPVLLKFPKRHHVLNMAWLSKTHNTSRKFFVYNWRMGFKKASLATISEQMERDMT